MTSVFGDLDTTQIGDDPYYTKPDTYWAICTDFKNITSKDGSEQAVITWTIDEPDNEYHGNNIQEYYPLFPGRKWEEYTADEKKRTKYFKKRLREAFDLSETQIQALKFSDLIGIGAYITLVENPSKTDETKKYINVNKATSKRLHDEEKNSADSTSASLGL